MATLQIVKLGDPILRKVCRPVGEITPKICQLLDDMKETLKAANGVGLAAPQVGIMRRLCLEENDKGEVWELINPRIIAQSQERQHELEGCLSLPQQWGVTDRPMSVTVLALDRNGQEIQVSGTGLTARALCHELDHLDGRLFSDHAKMLTPEEIRQSRLED